MEVQSLQVLLNPSSAIPLSGNNRTSASSSAIGDLGPPSEHPNMQSNQLKRATTSRMGVGLLATLMAISLLGCAATGPVAGPPIEGPVGLGEIAAVDGPRVRPDRVIEDSRCPANVQCIQAGRLVVRATVLGGGWSKQIDLTLGIPVPVADGILTLVDATPVPVGSETAASVARFSFKFQGGR